MITDSYLTFNQHPSVGISQVGPCGKVTIKNLFNQLIIKHLLSAHFVITFTDARMNVA